MSLFSKFLRSSKVQICSNRRFSTSKCFSSQCRRSALSGDFFRHEMKKVVILKKNVNIANRNKSKENNYFYNMFLVRTTQDINNVFNSLRFWKFWILRLILYVVLVLDFAGKQKTVAFQDIPTDVFAWKLHWIQTRQVKSKSKGAFKHIFVTLPSFS